MLQPRAARMTAAQRRSRLLVALAAIVLIVAVIVSGVGSGGVSGPPAAGRVTAVPGDIFGYSSARAPDFVSRAIAGNGHVLFAKSPAGVLATAARVAAYRPAIDRATAGSGIDPALVEGLVFVESAGRPDVIAGSDPASAAGLTQILAATGQTLLGMHIDLARSRRLTSRIDAVAAGRRRGAIGDLQRRRAAIDDRFNPALELAATVRYLLIARRHFGRADLAAESYHMGIGNLGNVLAAYDGGAVVPYGRLYFDSTPTRHPAAFEMLAGFGDDSSLYLWRVLGAAQLMRLYRTDRTALAHLAALQVADPAGATVLHPPARTPAFSTPAALSAAYADRRLVPLPVNLADSGLMAAATMGSGAARVGAPASLYRGLRAAALRVLAALGARVRALSGSRAPLVIARTAADERYQQRVLGRVDQSLATGWTFLLQRRYATPAQAQAVQDVLDRLQSLDLVAWTREGSLLRVTVASDAASWLARQ